MPADDEDHLGLQFQYFAPEMEHPEHEVQAHLGEPIGIASMRWSSRGVINIEVDPEHQRQGVATAVWNEAHRLAEENARIPKPKHSPDRTNAGDAWARAVGGRLPRLKKIVDDS